MNVIDSILDRAPMRREGASPATRRIVMWLPGLTEHGGIARHNRTLCKAIANYARTRDTTVEIVSLRDPDRFFDPSYLTQPVVGCEAKRSRFALATLSSLRRGFDLLVVGVVDFGPLVPAARLRNPAGSILTVTHGIEVWKPLPRRMRIALTQASAVLSVSDFTADAVARRHGVSRARIQVIPPPLDPDFLEAATGRAAGKSPSSRLLSVSRLNEIDAPKGVQRVIEALPGVREAIPDVSYTVVGTGDDQNRLEGIAKELNVNDLCVFKGAVTDDELHACFRESDLFVLPSAKEGFGIVFLEAAAHEKAVVGGDRGGIPEVVVDGVTGVLVDPDDVSRLTDAISALLLDDDRRREMGIEGARRVHTQYGYELFESRTCDVIEQLTPGPQSPQKAVPAR